MSDTASQLIRSPSYPSMSLPEAVSAVAKIEGQYRSSPVDRAVAAKIIGYSSLSGPANKALAALASYGLVERAGKGEMRVTARAQAILYPKNENEHRQNLLAAGMEPALFQDLRERFPNIVPPEDGVVAFLNRQGFNKTAIRPATNAFLETLRHLQEAGATESQGVSPKNAPESPSGSGKDAGTTYGGAKVGDLVQWESDGVLRLEKPLRVRLVSDDGQWIAVEGSKTGIPMSEVIVQQPAPASPNPPPQFPLEDDDGGAKGTDLRFKVGKGIVVKVLSREELGADELDRLIKLLEAQKIALAD